VVETFLASAKPWVQTSVLEKKKRLSKAALLISWQSSTLPSSVAF
jgi:hypothetical protein